MGYSAGVFTYTTSGLPVVTGTSISSTVENAKNTETAAGLSTCVLKDGTQVLTANIPTAGFIFTGLGAGSAAGHSLRYQQLFTTSAVTLLGAMDWVTGANIASAATVNLTTATGNAVHITGTTTITAVTLGTGMWRLLIFDGALTLTHHATNNHLPGAVNITTAANDRALYWSDGTTVYCMVYVPAALPPSLPVSAAEQATVSGTSIDFTGIPSWVKRITLQFVGVSTNGTSSPLIQIGDSGGVETSGYLGAGGNLTDAAAVSVVNSTAGFIVNAANAAAVIHGNLVLTLEDSSDNTWTAHGVLAFSNAAAVFPIAGRKALSATLDRVRLTTVNGTDVFDAGAVNILYE